MLTKPVNALVIDIAQIALAFAAFVYLPAVLWPVLSLWLGFCYFAMFGLGHEGGHGLLSKRRWLNECLGQIAMLPTLWSLSVWRQDHRTHHRYTNLHPEDKAFRPMTVDEYRGQTLFIRLAYRFSRTYLVFISTMILQVRLHARVFYAPGVAKRGLALLQVTLVGAYLAAMIVVFGLAGLCVLVILPLVVFNLLFSMIAFLQHTNPAIHFKRRGDWDMNAENLYGTANVKLPALLDAYTHYTNHHLAHHNYLRVPAAELPAITAELLRRHEGKIVTVAYSWREFLKISKMCFLVREEGESLAWVGRRTS